MWLYRAHPGNPRQCAGADHSLLTVGRHGPPRLRLHPVYVPAPGVAARVTEDERRERSTINGEVLLVGAPGVTGR
jgi:hypothetical protein